MKTGKRIPTSGKGQRGGGSSVAPMPVRGTRKESAAAIGNRTDGRIAQMAAGEEYDEGEEESELPVGQLKRTGQAEAAVQRAPAPGENRTGMPDALKSGIESMSGMDMSEVRVHTNADNPAQLGNARRTSYARELDALIA